MKLDVADSAELKNVKTDCVIESLVTLGDMGAFTIVKLSRFGIVFYAI